MGKPPKACLNESRKRVPWGSPPDNDPLGVAPEVKFRTNARLAKPTKMIPSFFIRDRERRGNLVPLDSTAASNRQSFNGMHDKHARLAEFHSRAMDELSLLQVAKEEPSSGARTERIPRPYHGPQGMVGGRSIAGACRASGMLTERGVAHQPRAPRTEPSGRMRQRRENDDMAQKQLMLQELRNQIGAHG